MRPRKMESGASKQEAAQTRPPLMEYRRSRVDDRPVFASLTTSACRGPPWDPVGRGIVPEGFQPCRQLSHKSHTLPFLFFLWVFWLFGFWIVLPRG